jgi:DNA-binding transcriptional ArsR family regulator
MAYSKAPLFDLLAYQQSVWSKALSHPARITILSYLLHNGVTPFYILAKRIPLSKTTVSQHLRTLRQTGLIESFDKYPHTYYRLNRSLCKDLAHRLEALNNSFSADNTENAGENLTQG